MNTVDLEPNQVAGRVASRPLSLAFVAPGWPPDSFANGIVTVVAVVAEQLRLDGHSATVPRPRARRGRARRP